MQHSENRDRTIQSPMELCLWIRSTEPHKKTPIWKYQTKMSLSLILLIWIQQNFKWMNKMIAWRSLQLGYFFPAIFLSLDYAASFTCSGTVYIPEDFIFMTSMLTLLHWQYFWSSLTEPPKKTPMWNIKQKCHCPILLKWMQQKGH